MMPIDMSKHQENLNTVLINMSKDNKKKDNKKDNKR